MKNKSTLDNLIEKAIKESHPLVFTHGVFGGPGGTGLTAPQGFDVGMTADQLPTGSTPEDAGGRVQKRKTRIREAELTAGSDNTKFSLKVDLGNPQSETKLGVRIKLSPKEGMLEPDTKDSLETVIMKKLNNSLEQYDIQVSKDTDVPDPTVLGFFIPLSQIKNMIVKSIKGGSTPSTTGGTSTPPKPTTPAKPATPAKPNNLNEMIDEMISEELIIEMRQRTLNEISQIVIREDFYGFINAGNNMLRSLEERGYDMRESKKYLAYLVKHNIM